jgi:ubiquinone/menaquinone biosynthesis C-methylase UbiE
MTKPNSSADQKSRTAAAFNQIAEDYDNMNYLRDGAAWLVEQAALPAGARVLDVATGTGWAAIAAARTVGPAGAVVGVDLARDMLDQAQRKIDKLGITNIELREADAERLDFADNTFDAVLCACGLFFVPDMPAALREWRRTVKPGGQVAFTSFGANLKQPLVDLFNRRLSSYGIDVPPFPAMRLADPDTCRSLLLEAGLVQIEVRSEQRGYYLASANLDQYWQTEIWSSVNRSRLLSLAPPRLEQFKAEHISALEALATPNGIWIDIPFNFARGWKQR